jgi:hypothetical protein
MILVHLNKDGYYVTGPGIEITRSCSASLEPLHHIHIVLWYALLEFVGEEVREEIVIYNDSRIIEDMNGDTQPIDDFCRHVQTKIRQELLPRIGTKVMFKKENLAKINSSIAAAHDNMLRVDIDKRNLAFTEHCARIANDIKQSRRVQLTNLKDSATLSTEKWYQNDRT